jgi:hypothetical protein
MAYFHFVNITTGATAGFGYYDDRLKREKDGRWRWKERKVIFLGPANIDLAAVGARDSGS